MENIPNEIVHSNNSSAWNINGTTLGKKFRLAIVPYVAAHDPAVTAKLRAEAHELALLISYALDSAEGIDKIRKIDGIFAESIGNRYPSQKITL